MMDSIIKTLARTNPFEMLPDAVLNETVQKVKVETYTAGTYVFKQGEPSLDCLFVVMSGSADIVVTDDRGQESVVGFRRRYDFFGETVVLSRERYPGSARAHEDLVCCLIFRKDLERLIYAHPEFSGFFNTLLAERMRLMYQKISSELSFEPAAVCEHSLFRRKVADVMTFPVTTCSLDTSAREAARLMTMKNISGLVVVDEQHHPKGMLTAMDMVRRLVADSADPGKGCPVQRIMNPKLAPISPEAYIGQAMASMIHNQVKTLAVMERGTLVGIVSLVDLVKTPGAKSLLLIQEIEKRQTIDSLAEISLEFNNLLGVLLSEQAGVNEILAISSDHHDRLIRRIIELSEEEMKRSGYGSPPVDYCWINMGSTARREQTLRTDQDNAIIYADPDPSESRAVEEYFSRLAELAVEGLYRCGFQKCTGDVMAVNPKWRGSISGWMDLVRRSVESFDPEDVRTLTILLDYRPIGGNPHLTDRLWEEIFSLLEDAVRTEHLLIRDDQQFRPPINFLGNIVTDKNGPHKNEINLKTGGLVHFINGMRLMAIKNKIREVSTLGRLTELIRQKVLTADEADFFRTSFETLMMFKIRSNLHKWQNGMVPDNYLNPGDLKKGERMLLKDALSGVVQFQKLIQSNFKIPWLNYFQ
ncbi:MAG: DUF294 nucleotidyltransferase-like domain-containing protein [Desulfococcaceae bacterium]